MNSQRHTFGDCAASLVIALQLAETSLIVEFTAPMLLVILQIGVLDGPLFRSYARRPGGWYAYSSSRRLCALNFLLRTVTRRGPICEVTCLSNMNINDEKD